MNANAKKWVAALRSGKYKQGKYRLRAGNAYCCLGVAYRVLGYDLSPKTRLVSLSLQVKDLLGLTQSEGAYGRYGCNHLTADNDAGKSFAEIAAIIESEPEGLFRKDSPDEPL